MADLKFIEQLNDQLGSEFAAHLQYISIASYFDGLTMPQMAYFFYRQGNEEREHAMMMIKYIVDSDESVHIPAVPEAIWDFKNVREPVELALFQEKRVQSEVHELLATARATNDYASEQFMQWFIKEQVEEIAVMNDLLAVVTRSPDNIEAIEEYIAREAQAARVDATAPRMAGA
jgi:ferritin